MPGTKNTTPKNKKVTKKKSPIDPEAARKKREEQEIARKKRLEEEKAKKKQEEELREKQKREEELRIQREKEQNEIPDLKEELDQKNQRDMPLFPHDPSPSDIKQGYIGDCYMVSVLANIARTDPNKIKESIRDNGDGTVTVRLFQRTVPKDRDYFAQNVKPPSHMEPFYVTVDKTVPKEKAARNCLWAAMIEKAVVASGLTRDKKFNDPYARPVPDNIEELYDLYKNMREDQRPSKIECPWLFDKDNNLVKWKADYAQIEGGMSEMFTESFLGEQYEAVRQDTSPSRSDAAKDVIYDFILMQVGEALVWLNKGLQKIETKQQAFVDKQNEIMGLEEELESLGDDRLKEINEAFIFKNENSILWRMFLWMNMSQWPESIFKGQRMNVIKVRKSWMT